jgi:ubiquinone/menaquinone biosynthesis C-methylase UbiE
MDDKNFDEQSALDWSSVIESNVPGGREKDFYPRIDSWMDEFSLKKILDIGSGQGISATKINLHEREYIGVDPSQYLVDRAKGLYTNLQNQFVLGNA